MIIKLPETESTNKYLNKLTKNQELKNKTIVITDIQTNGKGQHNNYWESEPYKNLTFSIFYKNINLDVNKQFYISIAVSLGITDFLKKININPKIKWPNDIYVNNKKICGILIENNIFKTTIKSTIIGIGLNVNQTKFTELTKNATSIKLITNKNYELNKLFNLLINNIDNNINTLIKKDFISLKSNYLNNMYLINKTHTFKIKNTKLIAKIKGIEDTGQLIVVDKNNNINKYFLKEIIF